MRKSRFTGDRVVRVLREADRKSVPEIAGRHRVSGQSLYTWRRRYGGSGADARSMRELAAHGIVCSKDGFGRTLGPPAP